jgi:hypothetical protein
LFRFFKDSSPWASMASSCVQRHNTDASAHVAKTLLTWNWRWTWQDRVQRSAAATPKQTQKINQQTALTASEVR